MYECYCRVSVIDMIALKLKHWFINSLYLGTFLEPWIKLEEINNIIKQGSWYKLPLLKIAMEYFEWLQLSFLHFKCWTTKLYNDLLCTLRNITGQSKYERPTYEVVMEYFEWFQLTVKLWFAETIYRLCQREW